MTTDVITAGVRDSILSAAESMTEHGFHHMPVADEEEGVVGMIATSNLAVYLSQTGQLARSQRRHFRLTSALLHLLGEALGYACQSRIRRVVVMDREGRDVHFAVDHHTAAASDRIVVAVFIIRREWVLEADGVRP